MVRMLRPLGRRMPTGNELREVARLIDTGALAEGRRFSRGHGTSLLAYPDARRSHLAMLPSWIDPRDGLVLDVGANEGSWTAQLLHVFPGARVRAFEPGPEPGRILKERFAGVADVAVDLRAVTDASGVRSYHATRASVFASLLPPSADLHDRYDLPGDPTEVLDIFDVHTVTLDEAVGKQQPVSLMKLDVQGAELAVLRGGERTLMGVQAVLAEVLYVPHYDGDATFSELNAAMLDLGFELLDLARPFRLGEGPALWADACYARPAPA